jgi:CheY-like chemotaxis protein
MPQPRKRILLVDVDDPRRDTRIRLLSKAGYEVHVRKDSDAAERLKDEWGYDLVVVAINRDSNLPAEYSDRLSMRVPDLPILLLVDNDAFVPFGTLSRTIETGDPIALLKEIARMLTGSERIH